MTGIRKAGIVCCSDGHPASMHGKDLLLADTLRSCGIETVFSPHIYAPADGCASACAQVRAQDLMNFFCSKEIDAIFDISGGDFANEILDHLDYDVIRKSRAQFWGYSDLTTIINAIYAQTGKSSVLYNVRNLVSERGAVQTKLFSDMNLKNDPSLFSLPCRFLRGTQMHGILAGGNIRCLLKLAGTPYFPDFENKILLLEARSGSLAQISAYMAQLRQTGAFRKASGILLGTFSQFERDYSADDLMALVLSAAGSGLPIAKTQWIGHGSDSRAALIGGKEYHFYAQSDKK